MKPAIYFFAGTLCATLVFVFAQGAQTVDAQAQAAQGRVYELRTYTANEGKIEDLHARFRTHTNHLFVKHGMTLIGYWMPTEGDNAENTLIYLLAHENREAAKQSWAAFGADPEWKAAYEASHANGALVGKVETKFLAPTDYSPLR